jgi:hypothetical protein
MVSSGFGRVVVLRVCVSQYQPKSVVRDAWHGVGGGEGRCGHVKPKRITRCNRRSRVPPPRGRYAVMLMMLGFGSRAKKKKERENALEPDGQEMFQAKPVALAFSERQRPLPNHIFWFARSQEGSEAAAGRARRERRKHRGPLVGACSFFPRAVLRAWCCTFAHSLPMGYQPRPPILSLGRCHTHPNPALGSGLALLFTLVDVSGAGQLSTGAPCRQKVGGLLTNTQRREAR